MRVSRDFWAWPPAWWPLPGSRSGTAASSGTTGRMKMTKSINRRDFLKVAAVGAAAMGATQALQKAKASEDVESGPNQWVMVIDQSKCIGCGYCTLACQAHNDIN